MFITSSTQSMHTYTASIPMLATEKGTVWSKIYTKNKYLTTSMWFRAEKNCLNGMAQFLLNKLASVILYFLVTGLKMCGSNGSKCYHGFSFATGMLMW